MMKIYKIIVIAVSAFLVTNACSGNYSKNERIRNVSGKVFYYGFEIQRITGLHESEIAKYGCAYRIDRVSFVDLLSASPVNADASYNKLDVRAVVMFPDEVPYFIDYDGKVRRGGISYSIDKNKFVSLLALLNPGKCRK